jgi:hypothetical protein
MSNFLGVLVYVESYLPYKNVSYSHYSFLEIIIWVPLDGSYKQLVAMKGIV